MNKKKRIMIFFLIIAVILVFGIALFSVSLFHPKKACDLFMPKEYNFSKARLQIMNERCKTIDNTHYVYFTLKIESLVNDSLSWKLINLKTDAEMNLYYDSITDYMPGNIISINQSKTFKIYGIYYATSSLNKLSLIDSGIVS